MNRLFPRYPHAALALGLVAVLSACESPQPQASQNPGGLPRVTQGERPRVTAATYLAYGELLERRGDVAKAAEQYRKAIAESPDLAAARNRLGVTLNKLAQHDEATAQFREALKLQPNDPALLNNLGFSLYLAEDYAAADELFTDLLDARPTFRRARMNHGLVLARLGRDDEALTEFTFVTEPADAYYNLAVIQAECGRYASAATSLDQALQHNPEFVEARQQLRELARLAAGQQAQMPAVAAANGATLAADAIPMEVAVATTPQLSGSDNPATEDTAEPTGQAETMDPPVESTVVEVEAPAAEAPTPAVPAPDAVAPSGTTVAPAMLPMVEVRPGTPSVTPSAAWTPAVDSQASQLPAARASAPVAPTTQPAAAEQPGRHPSPAPLPMREVKPVPAAA